MVAGEFSPLVLLKCYVCYLEIQRLVAINFGNERVYSREEEVLFRFIKVFYQVQSLLFKK